ncbi:MAG: aminotransferase class V-fold PLP-dependent enzyme, partial [Clostridia bacterium]|nr:aminotransferase class V-fold PLP-dependent enzyme [Clostridia bacterium]
MVYLDNAATSYKKPDCVLRATCEALYKHSANPGRSGHDLSVTAGEILYDTRKSLAKLFNVENPDRIVFTQNTTDALNKGIKGVMSRGGHVITTSMEHNSVIRPIKALEEKCVTHSIWTANEQGELDFEKLKKLIKRETKLIVMMHASNVCGNIYDIKKAAEIAHQNNVLLMVDAAQSAGSVDIDCSNIDLLAFPGHKGLMAPMGSGGLYVKEGVKIKPIIEGGTGSVSESLTQPD